MTDNNKNHNDRLSSWLLHDHKNDWFMDFGFDHDDIHHEYGGDMGAFEFDQKLFEFENNVDLFGGDFVFSPDLNASHNVTMKKENSTLYIVSIIVLYGEKQSHFLDHGGTAHSCGGAPDRCGDMQPLFTEPMLRLGRVLHSTIRNML
ncbi:hypothetical protein E3N88_02420 [Mikania micrantha]|uniref:Uncharacterized protein n=1 Tax=Mikania micrantha TaxID=192012 RepID=A0A5N6Q3Q6_9ASTR|nr:hypothetical protein E3N88_02420 [Mikania micrantha]